MAGKSIESRAPTTIEALKAKVEEKYRASVFEHPEGYGFFELARLKRHEREHIQRESRRPDGLVDTAVQNRMAAAYGIVSPWLVDEPDAKKRAEKTIEELKEYPDDFIEPIATEVWRMSNEFRDRLEENGKGDGTGPNPFSKMSSFDMDSASSSTGSPTSSTPSTTKP